MKWTVNVNRKFAEKLCYTRGVIISISDPRSPHPKLSGYHPSKILRLRFHDVLAGQAEILSRHGYIPPAIDHAKEIVKFVLRNWDEIIVVHCEKGVSRSAAVCRWLKELGWRYIHPHGEHGLAFANGLLYQLLNEAYESIRSTKDVVQESREGARSTREGAL